MKTKKFWRILLASLMVLAAISCSPDNPVDKDEIKPQDPPKKEENRLAPLESENGVRLAFTAAAKVPAVTRALERDVKYEFDETILRTDIDFTKPHEDKTPAYFFLDLDCSRIYMPVDSADPKAGRGEFCDLTRRIGDTVNNVNMLSSKGMPTLPIDHRGFYTNSWEGFAIQEVPFLGDSNKVEGFDAYMIGSLVGVSLPDGADIEHVKNAMSAEFLKSNYNIDLDPDLAWFSYHDLIPIKGEFLSYIVFQTGIESPVLINEQGVLDKHIWGGFDGTGNASGIALPMEKPICLKDMKNPVIRIEHDVKDLVSFYKMNDNEWIPCLNLADPFPFEIECEEYSEYDDAELDSKIEIKNIKDAVPLAPLVIRRAPKLQTLQFIKPNYADIHHIEIRHASVNDESLSEIIYEGNENVFDHKVDVYQPHFYWAYTVNSYGEKSDAAVFQLRPGSTLPVPPEEGEGGGEVTVIPDPNAKEAPFKVADPVEITAGGKKALVQVKFDKGLNIPAQTEVWNAREHLRADRQCFKDKEPAYKVDLTNLYFGFTGMDLFNTADPGVPDKNPSTKHVAFSDGQVQCDFVSESYFYLNVPETGTFNGFHFTNMSNGVWSPFGTYVVIQLPPGVDATHVNDALPYPSPDNPVKGLAAIDLKDLIPFEHLYPEQFIFQAGFNGMTVTVPDGITDRCIPVLGLPSVIPLDNIENPALTINCDPTEFVSLYLDDTGRYVPIINLDRPFPFAIGLANKATP